MGSNQKKTPTFRREERSEFRTQLSELIARVLSWIVLLIPWPLRDAIANAIGSMSFRSSTGYRSNVEANVSTVLGDRANDAEIERITRHIFRTNARNFSDLLTLTWRSPEWLARKTNIASGSFALIDTERARGKGVIFVSAHLGCFDFIGQSFQAHGYPLTVVTGRTTSRFVFDGVTWLRGRRGARMVEPTPAGIRHVIKALRNNECAVIVADRDFFENGYKVDFFGRPTTLPPGAVRIARDTGAVIIPLYANRGKGNLHDIYVKPPIYVEKTKDVDADIAAGMRQLLPVLEEGIATSLDQWVMFQRVWPEAPPESIRIFPTGSPLESPLLERVAQALPEKRINDDASSPRRHGTESS